MAPAIATTPQEQMTEAVRQALESIIRARSAPEKSAQAVLVEGKLKKIRESCIRRVGIDPATIGWRHPRFSAKGLLNSLEQAEEKGLLREANAESSFGQLLRYGVQNFLFDKYQSVETVWTALFDARPSGNRQEWYPPLYGAEVPEDVDAGDHFDDSRIRGIDVMIVNKKVGRILSIERELVDDDQTGQIVMRASKLGERMRYKEEIDCLRAIINARDFSTSSAGTTGYTTTIGNKNAGPNFNLNQANLEQSLVALRKITDPLGNLILVRPDTVLCGPDNEIPLWKLLNSMYQPSIPGVLGVENIGNAASGGTGWTLTENFLKGRLTPVVAPLLVDPRVGVGANAYWFVMEAKAGNVMQERDPLEVAQENPLSGEAFETDAYRYRVRRRYAPAVIEPRYSYQGNGTQ